MVKIIAERHFVGYCLLVFPTCELKRTQDTHYLALSPGFPAFFGGHAKKADSLLITCLIRNRYGSSAKCVMMGILTSEPNIG